MAYDGTAAGAPPAARLAPNAKADRAADEGAAALLSGDDEGGAGFPGKSR